tara:strand:- start:205 stop:333 length:129 start_codon:yes stop_codon:yes gene_type:complete
MASFQKSGFYAVKNLFSSESLAQKLVSALENVMKYSHNSSEK